MLFLPVLIIALLLYMSGHRVISLFIFFFFVFDGFQIVPEELFDTGLGISKSLDFALFYVFILFIWGCFYYHDFIPLNKMTLFISIYLGSILVLIAVNKFIYGLGWGDIIRTSRNYFFVLSYYPLRRVRKEEIDLLLKLLLMVVLFQSLLYIIQAFTGTALMIGEDDKNSGNIPYRFYNTPKMLYFFIYYLICYPFIGKKSARVIIPYLLFTYLLPMHRGFVIILILTLGVGYVLYMGNIKKFLHYLPHFVIISIPFVYLLFLQLGERTFTDLKNIQEGELAEIDNFDNFDGFELDTESTFTFRIAHLTERLMYVKEHPVNQLFGIGLMPENSPWTKSQFNFVIGLTDEKTGGTVQLETGDIAWSNMVVRYGLLGTVAYLIFYIGLVYFLFIHRDNKQAFALLLYMLLILGVSLTSDLFYHVHRLVFVFLLFEIIDKQKSKTGACVE